MIADGKWPGYLLAQNIHEGCRPKDDFVICCDIHGVPTAIYGSDTWDLNPVRLGAKSENRLNFGKIFDFEDQFTRQLIGDVKYLLFCLIFFAKGGAAVRLSVGVISKYYRLLRNVAIFCYMQRDKPMIGALSLKDLFSNPTYLASFIRSQSEKQVGVTQRKALAALVMHMVSFGERRLGYKLHSIFSLEFESESTHQQHPVIPVRIYLAYLNLFDEVLSNISRHAHALTAFLNECKDPAFAYSHKCQRKTHGIGEGEYRPTFVEALEKHGLSEFFSGDFSCASRHHLSGTILRIQFYLKMIIHAYTGMRDQEVMCMLSCALRAATVRDEILDSDGLSLDSSHIIEVVSSTTKFAGYQQVVSWLATPEVAKAVKAAQEICRSLCNIHDLDPEKAYLFLNPAILSRKIANIGVAAWDADAKPASLLQISIESDDLYQLAFSDPTRDFLADEDFQVDNPWPLCSHQFRRSLVFYGSSSGLISMPSMKRQMKHVSMRMTRYYSNGFEKLSTIFGYYDAEQDKYVLPKSHVAFDLQMAMPIGVAYDLLINLFGEDSPLFGGVGSYAQKQRAAMGSEVSVADLRKETQRLVSSGRMSYRPTLLGGCTKVGECDAFMLCDFTACLSCEEGIIKLPNLEEAICESEREVEIYAVDSGEYQIASRELQRLNDFHKRHVERKGLIGE